MDNGITEIIKQGDIAALLHALQNDSLDRENQRQIDLHTRISSPQFIGLSQMDALVELRFLPISCSAISHKIKRLSISVDGKSREELVSVFKGAIDQLKQPQPFGIPQNQGHP